MLQVYTQAATWILIIRMPCFHDENTVELLGSTFHSVSFIVQTLNMSPLVVLHVTVCGCLRVVVTVFPVHRTADFVAFDTEITKLTNLRAGEYPN